MDFSQQNTHPFIYKTPSNNKIANDKIFCSRIKELYQNCEISKKQLSKQFGITLYSINKILKTDSNCNNYFKLNKRKKFKKFNSDV